MKKIAFPLFFIITIFGCVSQTATKPIANSDTSIVEILKSYRYASEAGLISPYKNITGVVDRDGFKAFEMWWCLDSRSSKDELISLIEKHCEYLDGKFSLHSGWCASQKNEDPLYHVAVGPASMVGGTKGPYCTSATNIATKAIEGPIGGSSLWNNKARNMGYMKQAELQEKNRKIAEEQRAKQIEINNKKIAQAEYMKKNRGTQICKKSDWQYTYIGFVEDSTNAKIKISISAEVLTNRQSLQNANFKPTVIWDDPMNWYICE